MKLKKVFFLFLISILLIPCFVKAEEDESNNIRLDSITLLSKSENAEEVSSAKLDGKKISLDLKLYDPGDYVEYSIKIKNVSEKEYTFDKSTFKVEKEYLTYEFSYDEESNVLKPNEERILKLKVLYTNKVPETKLVNDSFNAENNLIISLTTNEEENTIIPDIINPETGLTNPIIFVGIMVISGTMLFVILKTNRKTKIISMILFALTIIPLYTYALTKIDIDVDAKVLIDGKEAYFLPGTEVNVKMKKLAGNDTSTYNVGTPDSNVLHIIESKIEPITSNKEDKNIVSSTESKYPIYMWYEDNIIYWWSEDKSPNVDADGTFMFATLTKLTDISGLSNFDTSRLETMYGMFMGYSSFGVMSINDLRALSNWDTSNVTDMIATFQLCTSLTSLEGLENWNVSNVKNMYGMFLGSGTTDYAMHIKSLKPLQEWNVSNAESFAAMFQANVDLKSLEGLENWDLKNAKTIQAMFLKNTSLLNVDAIYNWNTSSLTTAIGLFQDDRNIQKVDFGKMWDFSKITSIKALFYNATNLSELNLENIDLNRVTDVGQALYGSTGLTKIKTPKAYPTDVNVKIDLPATFCDEDGNHYTKLDNTSPTQVWLTKCE